MDSDGQQLGVKQPATRMVVTLKQRLNNEEVYNDVTIDLTGLDLFGDDNVVLFVEPRRSQIQETSDLPSENLRLGNFVVSAHHFRATVKEVIAGLLAVALIAYFLLTGLPSISLPIIGGILGYYFGSRNTLLRN